MAASLNFANISYFLQKNINHLGYIFYSFPYLKNKQLALGSRRKLSTKRLNSLQICIDTVRKYDYENYLCTLLLSDPARSAAFVVRAFNVEISQVQDLVSTAAIGEMRLLFWKEAIDKTFAGNPPEQPVSQELSKLLKNTRLTKSWFNRLITSRELLLNDKPFLSIKDLENYCDNAVVPVYLLILQASGIASMQCDHVASHIGKCQGICNILRGIPYNTAKRRLCLPLELISKHKISQEALFNGEITNLTDAVYDLSCVAHQHLKMARKLSKDVPKHIRPIFLPAVSCGSYLENIEKRNFNVFHSSIQIRNNWLPLSLWTSKLRNKY